MIKASRTQNTRPLSDWAVGRMDNAENRVATRPETSSKKALVEPAMHVSPGNKILARRSEQPTGGRLRKRQTVIDEYMERPNPSHSPPTPATWPAPGPLRRRSAPRSSRPRPAHQLVSVVKRVCDFVGGALAATVVDFLINRATQAVANSLQFISSHDPTRLMSRIHDLLAALTLLK